MKKMLMFMLVLSLALSSFPAAFAADTTTGSPTTGTRPKTYSDVAGLSCEEAVNVLSTINVVSGYEDGTFKPETVVTRAEMATLIVKSLGMGDYTGGTTYFTDCKEHWAESFISYASSIGVISGRTPEKFDPDATVSYDEAATMLVKALGYNDNVLLGEWPVNYVTKATELGILSGLKSGEEGANRGDCAIMLYQTLDEHIGKVNNGVFEVTKVYKKGITDANAALGTLSEDTMLVRLGIVMIPEFIVRGDEKSVINVRDYQGASITAYQNSNGEIIGIKEIKTTFLTGKFRSTTEFKVQDTIYKVAASSYNADKVYQFNEGNPDPTTGTPIDSLVSDTDYTIAVELSGNTIRKIYSANRWSSSTVEVTATIVRNISSDKKIVNNANFILDDEDKIDTTSFALFGVNAVSEIKSGHIMTYSVDDDGYVTRVAVGTQSVTGPITRLSSDYTKMTINGKEYQMYNNAAFDSTLKVGNSVKLYLTYEGKVFKTDKTVAAAQKDKYGIVLKMALGNSTGFGNGSESQIRIFGSDNKETTYDLNAKQLVKDKYLAEQPISGSGNVAYVTDGTVNAELAPKTVVKFTLDADGKIDMLQVIASSKMKYTTGKVTASGAFDGHAIASDAVLFIADQIEHESGKYSVSEDYSTATRSSLLKKTLSKAVYALNDKEQISVMVVRSDSASDDMYAMVNEFYSDSSDAGYGVELLIDGKTTTYHTSNDYSSIVGIGSSLMSVKLKADETIDALTPVVADNKEKFIKKIDLQGARFFVENDRLKVASSQAEFDAENYDLFNKILGNRADIYVWDSKEEKWTVGDVSELDDSLDYADDYLYIYELDSVDNPGIVTHVVLYAK